MVAPRGLEPNDLRAGILILTGQYCGLQSVQVESIKLAQRVKKNFFHQPEEASGKLLGLWMGKNFKLSARIQNPR